MKTCRKCNIEKPLECFHKHTAYADGLNTLCADCKKEVNERTNPISNSERMWVNGKYVSKKHPLFKAGRYKAFDDVWSHIELDTRTTEGEVYIIANKAFPNW